MGVEIRLLVVILLVITLTACSLADKIDLDQPAFYLGEHFTVYDITKDNQPQYRYEIYDRNGIVIKDEIVWRTPPHITYIFDNTLLSIAIGVGTDSFLSQYYDIQRNIFSEIFQSPVLVESGKIVYVNYEENNCMLVVRDIFNKDVFYRTFSLDSSSAISPIIEAGFLDENTLYIEYWSGEMFEVKTEILDL